MVTFHGRSLSTAFFEHSFGFITLRTATVNYFRTTSIALFHAHRMLELFSVSRSTSANLSILQDRYSELLPHRQYRFLGRHQWLEFHSISVISLG
jgi:hypothetical protein